MKITFSKAGYNLVLEKAPLSRKISKIPPQIIIFFKYSLLLTFIESHSITLRQNQILSPDNYSFRYFGPSDLKQTEQQQQFPIECSTQGSPKGAFHKIPLLRELSDTRDFEHTAYNCGGLFLGKF